jgi:hypothetical protein
MTYDEWIEHGQAHGLDLRRFCAAHETPFTKLEADAYENGDDPCIPAVRLIENGPQS